MESEQITVYSFRRCPFAMRVRIALHEKQIPFQVQEEDLKNISTELRRLHPEGKVPVLVHGQLVIYESAIITEYVDDLFSLQNPLMPASASDRAQARLWTYWCNHVFKGVLDRYKYGTARFPEADCINAEPKLRSQLSKLEMRLVQDEWLVGDRISLADIHVFPFARQLAQIKPTPALLKDYPAVVKWVAAISERPSFKQSMMNTSGASD